MNKKRIIKIIFIFILILSSGVLSGLFINNQYLEKNLVEAESVTGVFNIIGKNNWINIELTKEIKEIKNIEWAKLKAELKAEEERIKQVKLQEEERLKEEERQKEIERLATIEREAREQRKKAKLDKGNKIAYLTFDDGPSSKATDAILDILADYDIKATFFVQGKMVVNYPEVLKRTFDEGHAIGNHTYSHDYGYLYSSSANFMKDLARADVVLKDVLGKDFETKIMRFPGGSFGKQKSSVIKVVTDAGYTYYDWNALNGDAEGILMPNDYLLKRLKETYKNKASLIVLMHDTDAKTTTVESLRSIIDFLIDEGYTFDVIDENYE